MSDKNKKQEEKYTTEEVLHTLDNTAIQSEKFLEKFAKPIAVFFGVIILGIIGYFGYLKFVLEPKNNEAFKDFAIAQNAIMKDSLDLALGGKGGINGFDDIIKNYAGTDAAKLSNYYAGIINYEKGKYQQAIENFKAFSSDDDILNSIAIGAIGDCLVQLGKNDEALKNYKEASNNTKNYYVAYSFTKKAALLEMDSNKNKEALELFNEFKNKFPEDNENIQELDSYIELLTYKTK